MLRAFCIKEDGQYHTGWNEFIFRFTGSAVVSVSNGRDEGKLKDGWKWRLLCFFRSLLLVGTKVMPEKTNHVV